MGQKVWDNPYKIMGFGYFSIEIRYNSQLKDVMTYDLWLMTYEKLSLGTTSMISKNS